MCGRWRRSSGPGRAPRSTTTGWLAGEGDRTRRTRSAGKMDAEAVRQKAREKKAEALRASAM